MNLFKKIFGSKNDREIRRLVPRVHAINALEPAVQRLSDEDLRAKTMELKTKVEQGAGLDDVLHEAFAVVREAGRRVLNMRHFDVQLIGGMVLHSGKIAEMRTGEGKTLVATLPAYLNALSNKGVHVVTVNDYLANRDAEWMGKIYRALGMSVGVIVHGFDDDHKQRQYACDITYGTNSEFGFDYLRDNMKYSLSEYVQQRGQNYAIIDEVDSVLIDEARTPLIISGAADESTDKYITANQIVAKLRLERDYTIDEKSKNAVLTDEGTDHVERMLKVKNLYEPENIEWLHHITKALQAHACYKRDVDYLVAEGEVLIIDEHTGRTMPGRRWSDGLHQAIEAKEGVKIERENQTLATISYQNLYRMYGKLSGMTGTADTEAEEFHKIYKLDVVVIPTNRSMIRSDHNDLVYKTEAEKFSAVVEDIKTRHERGQPVLVGTRSVDKSEVVSRLLKRHNIEHTILNAKFHRQEGEIIAQAGRYGAVTISTNMAGRGTDILLGGNPEYLARAAVAHEQLGESPDPSREQRVLAEFRWLSGAPNSIPVNTLTAEHTERRLAERMKADSETALAERPNPSDLRREVEAEARAHLLGIIERYAYHLEHFERECVEAKKKVIEAGGLHVLGTERHESRRVDNQLRGRAGRQGDPGSSQFYLSLQDDLMRLFGGDKLVTMMDRLGMEDNVPIEARMVTKSIEGAQRRVEGHHFDVRKNLIEYDDVLNQQRKAIYALRRRVLGDEPMAEDFLDMIERVILFNVARTCSRKSSPDEWRFADLKSAMAGLTGADFGWLAAGEVTTQMRIEEIEERLYETCAAAWEKKHASLEARFAIVGEHLVPKERLPALAKITEPVWRYLLRQIYLREIDSHWREHLTQMDHLKEGIHLRGYGQRDPKLEYKREGFLLYESMMREIDHNTTEKLLHVEIVSSESVEREAERQRRAAEALSRAAQLVSGGSVDQGEADALGQSAPSRGANGSGPRAPSGARSDSASARARPRPGRNDACWCGSGKKYKKCHLEEDERVGR